MENLALKLWEKHREAIALEAPVVIDSEEALFAHKDEKGAKSAVVFLPKSRPLIDMTLSIVSGIVERGGTIVLAGEKPAGIESAKKSYEKNIGPVAEKIVGFHSALYVGRNEALGSGRSLSDFLTTVIVAYGAENIQLASLPGVFSAGELDQGTKMLLDSLPYDKKAVLDVGCGAGAIGAIYHAKSPESVISMCDISPLALIAAEETVRLNGMSARVFKSDVFSQVAGTYDLIVSNPPFHKGIGTDYSFIEAFVQGAHRRLAPGGEIYLVANSFLAYERMFESAGYSVTRAAEDGKFKVLRIRQAAKQNVPKT